MTRDHYKEGSRFPHADLDPERPSHEKIGQHAWESREDFERMIRDLPEDQQTVVRLHLGEDDSFKDIAGILNLKLAKVQKLFYTAIKALQKKHIGFFRDYLEAEGADDLAA